MSPVTEPRATPSEEEKGLVLGIESRPVRHMPAAAFSDRCMQNFPQAQSRRSSGIVWGAVVDSSKYGSAPGLRNGASVGMMA